MSAFFGRTCFSLSSRAQLDLQGVFLRLRVLPALNSEAREIRRFGSLWGSQSWLQPACPALDEFLGLPVAIPAEHYAKATL